MFAFWKWGMPAITGKSDKVQSNVPEELYANGPGFVPDAVDSPAPGGPAWEPKEGELCKIKGKRFEAEMSTRGAALTHFWIKDARYAGTDGFDMSTTPDHERWRSLRTLFRADGATDQLKYDRFDWRLERLGGDGETGCTFTYADDEAAIKKTVKAGERPFELTVETEVKNLTDGPKKHRFEIQAFAFRTNGEVKGSLGRVSPFATELDCARATDVQRKQKDDFKAGWYAEPLVDRWVGVNNYYFVQAIIPEGGDKVECGLLAEERRAIGRPADDDASGAVYHGKLTYPVKELGPKEAATYRQTAFFGPKERDVLAQAAGGRPGLGDAINLGFFSPVAKFLIKILEFFHDKVTNNWGLAIIVMTICLRLILFPLSLKQIKTTIAMRKLKPEMDALGARYGDDAQAKQLATMELYRKHGVNPLGGCLPQLVQMPVWFAMYTTLQTAVEMYHTQFLWFTDLSAPDRFYILPLVLGVFMIVQQRIVPQQGMDPMQQKMMMYMLPAVFTVMMLFLPAALGVYMLTNSLLGIGQQLVVEKVAPRSSSGPSKGEIVVKQVDGAGPASLGKGKARV